MPYKLIERTSVRIRIIKDGTCLKQGSGVIVTYDNHYFVLTAFHCIGLDKNTDALPNVEDVIVEKQDTYTSPFNVISVLSICNMHRDNDFILIRIDYSDDEVKKCNLANNFVEEEKVRFCGYQHIHETGYRPFDGKIILISSSKFQIKLLEDTFQQGGEDGSYIAKGLSGSGVYIIKNKKPYLIGILNSVKDDQAWNDDIDCCPVDLCLCEANCPIEDLSDLEKIKEWSVNLEKEKTQEDIESYKSLNVVFFENLLRKNKIIYDNEEKANEVTNKELKKYLSFRENISLLELRYPTLYVRFQNIVKKFQDDVEDEYSRSVQNNNEAKDKKIELKDKLKEELESILISENIKNDDIKFDLADYQIIEWLLDCSLNFTKK